MDNYSELLHASIVSTNIVLENLTKSDIDLYPRIHDGIELQTIVDLESSEKEIRIFNSHLFEITDVFKIRVKEREVIVSIDGKIIEAQLEPFFQKSKVEKDSFLVSLISAA